MALHEAVKQKQLDKVEVLLAAGADVNETDTQGRTPLYVASSAGDLELVQALLAAGADAAAATQDGFNPLHTAARHGHHNVMQLLLAAGANFNAAANDDSSPLHTAARYGHHKVVRLLLEAGADVNAARQEGWTPLLFAAQEGHRKVVQLLLEAGAGVNAEGSLGDTHLHLAAVRGHHEVVQLLLVAGYTGAAVNTANSDGWTPLHGAASEGRLDVVTLLLRWRANPQLRTDSDHIALYQAANAGHKAAMQLLLEAWGQPGVPAFDLVEAAKAAAHNKHMAASVQLSKELHRLWPEEMPQLFERMNPVSGPQAVAALANGWNMEGSSLDEEAAAVQQEMAESHQVLAAVQHLFVGFNLHDQGGMGAA